MGGGGVDISGRKREGWPQCGRWLEGGRVATMAGEGWRHCGRPRFEVIAGSLGSSYI